MCALHTPHDFFLIQWVRDVATAIILAYFEFSVMLMEFTPVLWRSMVNPLVAELDRYTEIALTGVWYNPR